MPVEVELPDGTIVEFPDGMSMDQMRAALQSRFPRTASAETSGAAGRFAAPEVAGRTPPATDNPRSWASVPLEAVQNIPSSAAKFATDIVQPFLDPVGTVRSIGEIGYGLASKAAGALGVTQDPNEKEEDEATVDALGRFFVDRYGSQEALKRTLATDPVGALGDAALVLTGGGAAAARGPGVVGRAGRAASNVGRIVDPLNVAVQGINATGRVVAPVVGVTTGAGARPLQEAYAAGRTNNPVLAEHMRGQADINDVVDMAEASLRTIVANRRAAYRNDMAATRASQTPVNMAPIRRVLDRTMNSLHFRNIARDPRAVQAHTQVVAAYNEFLGLPPAERTAEALDALKQRVGAIQESLPFEQRNARRVVGDVYRAIGQEIRRQVPSYDVAMRNYTEAADNIDQIRRTMSVGGRATDDTTIRKLQSVMRNNVNTNYGARVALAEQLGQYQPNLMPALAGQALNSWEPRGLARMGANVTAIGSLMTNPVALASLPFTSPRLMGEASYGLGQGARIAHTTADAVGGTAVGAMFPYLYFGANALRPVTETRGLLDEAD